MKFTLQQFTDFLKGINLEEFRHKYATVKILEMDLPPNIQALKTIYEQYWDNKDNLQEPRDYEDYFDNVYYPTHENEIRNFWYTKSGFGHECDCFNRGLRARIYRTWASLITQIHGGYVAASINGIQEVQMGEDLDRDGVDFRIILPNKHIDIQVKKKTGRKEIARMDDKSSKNPDIKYVRYLVPQPKEYNDPYYKIKSKSGQLRESVKQFVKFNPNGTLDRLENGFVVFTPRAFEELL